MKCGDQATMVGVIFMYPCKLQVTVHVNMYQNVLWEVSINSSVPSISALGEYMLVKKVVMDLSEHSMKAEVLMCLPRLDSLNDSY